MKKNKILIFFLLIIILSIISYKYIYKNHRDIINEKSIFNVSTVDLINEYSINELSANEKYLDKTINVSGWITEFDLSANTIIIDNKLFAAFSNSISSDLKENSKIVIKGRFIGYDELLDEFKMDQCVIVK